MEEKSTLQGLLCFGGSFNPIHNAHLRSCSAVARSRGCHQALLIPSAVPPHKLCQNDMAEAADRLTMCRIAAATDEKSFSVSDIELRRSGPSYTIDTVRELKGQGHAQIEWLIGADMLAILPQWREAQRLIHEATILIMSRPGFEIRWEQLPDEFQFLKANVVEAPLMDVSATDIRKRVKLGQPIDHLVPAGVAAYIKDRGLYR